MKVLSRPMGMVQANCYLIVSAQNRAAIVDPGGDAAALCAWMQAEQVTPAMVLLTHAHFDHVAGLWDLLAQYDIPVYLHAQDEEMIREPRKLLCSMLQLYFTYQSDTPMQLVQDGDRFVLDELQFSVLHTPGHSKGSSCYLVENELFSGDTLFAGDVGRTDLYGGSFKVLEQSLQKIANLPQDYRIHPGHGPSSTLGYEKMNNMYLGSTL